MAVCSGLVWKKLITILNVASMFSSSGGALRRLFGSSFKPGSSLDEITLKVKCFLGSALVLPAGMHSSSSRMHIWIQTLLSPLPPGHPAEFSSSPKFTFLHQQQTSSLNLLAAWAMVYL